MSNSYTTVSIQDETSKKLKILSALTNERVYIILDKLVTDELIRIGEDDSLLKQIREGEIGYVT